MIAHQESILHGAGGDNVRLNQERSAEEQQDDGDGPLREEAALQSGGLRLWDGRLRLQLRLCMLLGRILSLD